MADRRDDGQAARSFASGETVHAALQGRQISVHPDTEKVLIERRIPHFERVLEIAVRATDETDLGYVGADIVVDAQYGPVILELNARPGLAIQIANQSGLKLRLDMVERERAGLKTVADRVRFARERFAHPR